LAAYHRPYSLGEVRQAIAQLEAILHEPDDVIRKRLHEIVPEYSFQNEENGRPVQVVMAARRGVPEVSPVGPR
jgi:hypothetical protein